MRNHHIIHHGHISAKLIMLTDKYWRKSFIHRLKVMQNYIDMKLEEILDLQYHMNFSV